MYRTTKTIERKTQIEVTDNYKSINQSINQGCMSPLLEVIPRTTDLHVSARTDVNNRYINHLELSIHLILGLPFGLLPSITPAYTFLVVPSLFMPSNLHFHFSCLLLITSKMSSCPSHCLTTSFLILSICLLPKFFSAHSFRQPALPAALSSSTPHSHTTLRAPSWH